MPPGDPLAVVVPGTNPDAKEDTVLEIVVESVARALPAGVIGAPWIVTVEPPGGVPPGDPLAVAVLVLVAVAREDTVLEIVLEIAASPVPRGVIGAPPDVAGGATGGSPTKVYPPTGGGGIARELAVDGNWKLYDPGEGALTVGIGGGIGGCGAMEPMLVLCWLTPDEVPGRVGDCPGKVYVDV